MPVRVSPQGDTAADAQPEDVVICGLSGRLPESNNIEEFRQHLINGEDMVTEDDRRWTPGMAGLPLRSGKMKDLDLFDATFFGVHPKQANSMDIQLRMLLEVTYEAIIDAGMNPQELRGSRTGVFVGCSASECHEAWTHDMDKVVGYEMTGCTRSMFANRLSFFFDFKGPSFAVDTACSSSLLALDQALRAIRAGQCDAAIVGGTSVCLKPHTTLQFQKLGMLSPDGACKSFDASGNGYCRSETVAAIYLQKASNARRIYATLVHSGTNCDGSKEQGITFPSGEVQKRLLLEVYAQAGVDPTDVSYVETHGTGTKAGDPQEVNSVVDVFCGPRRRGPLLIGSIKSNMGHAEPASGLAGLAKVIIAMEDGAIPANLHYKTPNTDIPGLSDGRLQVVTERTPWPGGYVAINSFGFGGTNVHVLLASHRGGTTSVAHPAAARARLVTYGGRTAEGVAATLGVIAAADDINAQALLQGSACLSASAQPYRGFTVIAAAQGAGKGGGVENGAAQTGATQTASTPADVQKFPSGERRPVWFIFAGMGTQWHGMGRDLMTLEPFYASIMRSDTLLVPYGLQLYQLLMKGKEEEFNDTLNAFVCIAAVQVALVCVLDVLGIKPDGIVGHSVGELGCAYADGSLTAEETVLAAYWRGRCVQEANLPLGGMAAVGLTWAEAKRRCPESVVPACHNSPKTVTISGPAAAVAAFVEQLKSEDIFAKEVKSAGVAFHSYYMAKTAPALKAALDKVIKEKRRRSSRWVSSSIPEDRWDTDLAQFSSADYHVNNLVSPVLFQEALSHVPQNAITIEIAPHCLLQAILKRSLNADCVFVGLMKRDIPDNMHYLLNSLGKLYQAGVDFNPLALFPPVAFPVPRGTAMLSPLVHWDHSQSWDVPNVRQFLVSGGGGAGGAVGYDIDPAAVPEDAYLTGHRIDGRVLYPATGYLVLAWRALARANGRVFSQMAVVFDDVHIHRATVLPKTGSVTLEVSIAPGTGAFEVCENGALVMSGRVHEPAEPLVLSPAELVDAEPDGLVALTSGDIYKELRLRGYDYGPTFRGIISSNNRGDEGELEWNDNWVTFLDTMLQMQILSFPERALRLPTRIQCLRIDPAVHQDSIRELSDKQNSVHVVVDRVVDLCVAGGVELLGLHATLAPLRQQQAAPVLEEFVFVPYLQRGAVGEEDEEAVRGYAAACGACVARGLDRLLGNGVTQRLPNAALLKAALQKASGAESGVSGGSEGTYEGAQFGLLATLRQVFESPADGADFVAQIGDLLESRRPQLATDALLTRCLQPACLKACLDVVLENRVGHAGAALRVVEQGGGGVYRHAVPQLRSQPGMRLEYSLVASEAPADAAGLEVGVVSAAGRAAADLVVASGWLSRQPDVAAALAALAGGARDDGFVLVHEPTSHFLVPLVLYGLVHDLSGATDLDARTFGPFCDEPTWERLMAAAGLEVVARKADGLLSTLWLCRVPRPAAPAAPVPDVVIDVDDLQYGWVDAVKAAMASAQEAPPGPTVWLRATDPRVHTGVVGLVNCLRQEPGGGTIRCIVNACLGGQKDFPQLNSSLMSVLAKKDLVMNVYRDGQWGSFRHLPMKSKRSTVLTEHAYVNVLTRGDLSSLRWIESPLRYFSPAAHSNKELCSVYYTSLNFRDIMLATGKLPPDAIPGDIATQDCILGMEFSGRNPAGNRIMGLLAAKGLATSVDADRRFVWPVPPAWSLAEAASVPVVYSTAYYALVVRGGVRRGDRVLIHSGSGGVGQAAIAVALQAGCEVFATVGSRAKRDYLLARFPQLDERHLANSRDATAFERTVLRATRGRGVDVVLNSLADDKLQASLRLLAPHGRFLEIGKYDLSNNSPLGMALFLRNVTFHGILLDALFEEGNRDWGTVADLVTQGIADGAVRPLQTTVFPSDDVEGAFRFMAQGRHIGKVLIKLREEESEKVVLPCLLRVEAECRTACSPRKAYVITGGLGGFGLELAGWLVGRGARTLVLVSRSGVCSGYQSRRVAQWRRLGVNVVVSKLDIGDAAETRQLLKEASDASGGGGVGGIYHLAMVLRDGFMENQDSAAFTTVGHTKVVGTTHLDAASRQLCRATLDHFVVFSSVSCGRGNAGQANYGFANSYMERVCEQRVNDRLPGLAVQWGAVGDVGIILKTMGEDTAIGGTLPQRIASCLAVLDSFLSQGAPVVSSTVLAEQASARGDAGGTTSLIDAVSRILGIKEASSVAVDVTLADLGLDSLMGVEVKQTLERDYELVLPMKEIRLLTMARLAEIAGGGGGGGGEPATATVAAADGGSPERLNDSGVSVRYDLSQLMPTASLVRMNETGGDAPPLFVVHSIQGSVASLDAVMALVTRDVYGLQCTADAPMGSVPQLATFYLQCVRAVRPTGPLHLAGYSFGACLAFEMALQLQADDALSSLTLLDGSHAFVAALTSSYKAKMSGAGKRAEEESEGLITFITQFTLVDYRKLSEEMQALPDWSARLALTVDRLMATGQFSSGVRSELEAAAVSFFRKLVIADEYAPSAKLARPVTLVRASAGHTSHDHIGDDYGLNKVCLSPVAVHTVSGDHDSFIVGASAVAVAQVINTSLSAAVNGS